MISFTITCDNCGENIESIFKIKNHVCMHKTIDVLNMLVDDIMNAFHLESDLTKEVLEETIGNSTFYQQYDYYQKTSKHGKCNIL